MKQSMTALCFFALTSFAQASVHVPQTLGEAIDQQIIYGYFELTYPTYDRIRDCQSLENTIFAVRVAKALNHELVAVYKRMGIDESVLKERMKEALLKCQ